MMAVGAIAGMAAVTACGGGGTERPTAPAAPVRAGTLKPAPDHGRPVITFRRIRYMGATMRILNVYRDGAMKVDIPNGGAGGSRFAGRLTPGTLRAIRRE